MTLQEKFILKANLVHNNKYDYSEVIYKKLDIPVKIICSDHGVFKQRPDNHRAGSGCPKCSRSNKINFSDFEERANLVHNNKYNYSEVNIINSKTKVDIICNTHGIFKQTPSDHLSRRGCLKCFVSKISFTIEKFILEAEKIYKKKYNYSKVKYKNAHTKLEIICPLHGRFFKTMSHFIYNKQGCPECSKSVSKGEVRIKHYLIKNNINFVPQKRFPDCKNEKPLPFDFYLPEYNLCIEYDGRQHTDKSSRFYSDRLMINDNIKNEYTKTNNINLLRIPYTEINNIEKIIYPIIN